MRHIVFTRSGKRIVSFSGDRRLLHFDLFLPKVISRCSIHSISILLKKYIARSFVENFLHQPILYTIPSTNSSDELGFE